MTGYVVFAVLCGALLHAAWNTGVKASADKQLDLALVHALGGVAAWPLLAWVGLPPAAAWPFLAASAAIHLLYFVTLNGAYQHGDLALTYPLMRGCAPLLLALGSEALLGERLSPTAWAGVCAITVGVLLLGLARSSAGGSAQRQRRAVAFALANALVIAAYSVVDGQGARAAKAGGAHAWAYVLALFVANGLPYPAWVWWRRSAAGRTQALAHARRRWPLALLGGLASVGSYGIALWAMTRAPVALVSALRETSVLFAAVLSWLVLKEPWSLQRALGALAIVAGVVGLRLS